MILCLSILSLILGRSTLDLPKYPTISKAGKTIEAFIPNGWKILDSAFGDLNRDGRSDAAIVIQSLDSTLDTTFHCDTTINAGKQTISCDRFLNPRRILIVLIKSRDGSYECALQDNDAILPPNADDEISIGDPYGDWMDADGGALSIRRGVLTLHMGQRVGNFNWDRTYRFRYQNGDWYLIGARIDDFQMGSDGHWQYDFNLLTGQTTENTQEDFDKTKRISHFNLGKKPLRKLRDFRPFAWEIVKGATI
jgi:hypothetical protein